MGSKGVVCIQGLYDIGFFLFSSDLFLVESLLVVLVQVHQVVVLIHVLRGTLFLDDTLLSTLLLVCFCGLHTIKL